jgi:hypothetical protein
MSRVGVLTEHHDEDARRMTLGTAVPETIVCILHDALTRSSLQELWEQHQRR